MQCQKSFNILGHLPLINSGRERGRERGEDDMRSYTHELQTGNITEKQLERQTIVGRQHNVNVHILAPCGCISSINEELI